MRRILFTILCFFTLAVVSQPVLRGNSVLIKPGFKNGDIKTYLVSVETRNGEVMNATKSNSQFKINFTVLDTVNGFTLSYKVETINTTNKNSTLASVVAKISNNLNFLYKINKNGIVTDLINIRELQKKLIRSLDSLEKTEIFNKQDQTLNSHLRAKLESPEGVEVCLTPLMLFNNIFNQPEFRNQKEFIHAYKFNILGRPLIPGTLINELDKINTNENYAKVAMNFKGNRDSAAQYNAQLFQQIYTDLKGKPYKSANLPSEKRDDFDREYEVMLLDGWPRKIYHKGIEFYFEKITTKIIITLVDN